ncbi:MAG: DUF3142 domain-containing protein [Capsulimonadaceae bacterium]
MSFLIPFGLCAVAVACALGTLRRHPPPPLQVSFWYWHTPFRLTATDTSQLRSLGVTRLFVHEGRFVGHEDRIDLAARQTFDGGCPFDVDLVFDFDPGLTRGFGRLDPKEVAATIGPEIVDAVQRDKSAGVRVTGVQLDFDVPTRLLPKYAALLTDIAPAIRGRGLALSVTVLPTWYGSRDLDAVLAEVNFSAPQFYEADLPWTLRQFATVSNRDRLRTGLAAAGRAGQPFYAGLPAYGHELVYRDGQLAGTLRDLNVEEAAREQSCRLVRAFPADAAGRAATRDSYIGEDIYDFAGQEVTMSDGAIHWDLVYDLPTPALVALDMNTVRRQRPDNCLGVIFFRLPEPGEVDALSLGSIAAAVKGRATQPHLTIHMTAERSPWAIIDAPGTVSAAHASMPLDVTISATNDGSAGTFVGPASVTLHLALDRPGIESADRLGFDSLDLRQESGDNQPASPCGPLRANVLDLTAVYLAAGSTVPACRFELPDDRPRTFSGWWTARCPGGFENLRGTIPPTPVDTLTRTQ